MKKLYLDCQMGAAGDMLTAALYELLPSKELFIDKMTGLGLPGVVIEAEKSVKCGVTGTHMSVKIGGDEEFTDHNHIGYQHNHVYAVPHEHNTGPFVHSSGRAYSYNEICGIISNMNIGAGPKRDALCVYELIAKAEAKVHGSTEGSVHFHEVGALDAIADIVGVCVLIDMLGISEIACSPVHVGSGTVKCAHGILPVPVPAAAVLLEGIPIYGGEVKGELCTPTGAALLRHFVSRFGAMEPFIIEKTGYGMGKKDFDRCNCVRAMLGESADGGGSGSVTELHCNLDDMTPEALGFAMQTIIGAGALDVFFTPVYMKKNRPAYMLTVLCKTIDCGRMTELVFKHTSTLGVRRVITERSVLNRRVETRHTRFGDVRVKISDGYGVLRKKLEYDDVEYLAKENGVSFEEIINEIKD